MRRYLAIGFLAVLWAGTAHASCTGANLTWTCTSWTDLKTLVQNTSLSTGATVTLEAGSHTASSGITFPSGKNIVVRGVGSSSTIVTSTGAFTMATIPQSSSRLTGMKFVFDNAGMKGVVGYGTGWRVDNMVMDYRPSGGKGYAVTASCRNLYYPAGEPGGLVDSSTFYGGRILIEGSAPSGSLGAEAYAYNAVQTGVGGPRAFYMEDNHFVNTTFGNMVDANYGAAFVVRFNTFERLTTVTGDVISNHGLAELTSRATKKMEAYHNTVTHNGGVTSYWRAGTGTYFNNTVSGTGTLWLRFDNRRDVETTDPCDGDASNYDSNELSNGWLCRDQVGSGYDLTAFDGSLPLPAQAKEPVYVWGNGSMSVTSVSAHIVEDRDYYNHSAATGSPQTTGVRSGIKNDLPAACTTGVAFWVTDEGYWNSTTPTTPAGVLYKCTNSSTVWTPYYTPYLYPHPLRSGLSAPTVK